MLKPQCQHLPSPTPPLLFLLRSQGETSPGLPTGFRNMKILLHSQFSACDHLRFFSAAIWLFTMYNNLLQQLCTKKIEQARHNISNLRTSIKLNQPQPQASSSNISKLPRAPRCTAPPFRSADELAMVSVPSDWVKVFCTKMAPAAEQMLRLSAKAFWETFTFKASTLSTSWKMESTGKYSPLGKWIGSHNSRHETTSGSSASWRRFVQRITEQTNASNRMYVMWKLQQDWTYHSLQLARATSLNYPRRRFEVHHASS